MIPQWYQFGATKERRHPACIMGRSRLGCNPGKYFAHLPGMSHFCWVQIGKGRLTVWHRPRIQHLQHLKEAGCQQIVTLLSEKEGGAEFGQCVVDAGMDWIWFPMKDGTPPEGIQKARIMEFIPQVAKDLERGKSILIHCSAGIHRSGMIAYAILRSFGFREAQAMDLIAEMRIDTATGLRRKHLDWLDLEKDRTRK